MGHHQVLVPLRFLALLGHFLATLLVLFSLVRASPEHAMRARPTARLTRCVPARPSQRDNVIVALRYPTRYTDKEYSTAYNKCAAAAHARPGHCARAPLVPAAHTPHLRTSALAAVVLTIIFQCICAFGFLFGFSTFDLHKSVMHLGCHTVAGFLLALTVILKGHYAYIWYIFAFFSVVPTIVEIGGLFAICFFKKRRW